MTLQQRALVGALCAVLHAHADDSNVAAGVAGVSLSELTAHPVAYDHRTLEVDAYPRIAFEGNELCAAPKGQGPCIWLNIDDGPWNSDKDVRRYEAAKARWQSFAGKCVTVRGTFNRRDTGHLGLWPGALEHVSAQRPCGK